MVDCMVKFIPIMVVAGRTQASSIARLLQDSVLVWSLWSWFHAIIPFYVPLAVAIIICTIDARVGYKTFFKPLIYIKARSFNVSTEKPTVQLQYSLAGGQANQFFTLARKPPSIHFVYLFTCYVYLSLAKSLSKYAKVIQRGI